LSIEKTKHFSNESHAESLAKLRVGEYVKNGRPQQTQLGEHAGQSGQHGRDVAINKRDIDRDERVRYPRDEKRRDQEQDSHGDLPVADHPLHHHVRNVEHVRTVSYL
jgi:hypothetical protein